MARHKNNYAHPIGNRSTYPRQILVPTMPPFTEKKLTTTAIYGGSFNPIHNAHLQIGRTLCEQFRFDEFWFMVSPQNPLKTDRQNMLDAEQRLHLVRLAIQGQPHLYASDFEFNLPTPSYTAHTLRALKETYPDRHFTLVIGADSYADMPRWKQHEEILLQYNIIVYPRPDTKLNPDQLPPNVTLSNAPLINISSTQIRQAIAHRQNVAHLLPPPVWAEIKQKGYYK